MWSYICGHIKFKHEQNKTKHVYTSVRACVCVYVSSGSPGDLHLSPLVWEVGQSHGTECWKSKSEQEGGGLCESLAALHETVEAWTRNAQRVCHMYAVCCLCGWTEQRANQMCYVYRVKAWLLTGYVRNLPLTLSLTFMLQQLTTCHMWPDLDMFWRTSQKVEKVNHSEQKTVMYYTGNYSIKQEGSIVWLLDSETI